jgi:hypothetical protein
VVKDNIMNFLAEWINVERDGLPEPDGNKTYFVRHGLGDGFGKYDYDTEIIMLDEPNEWGSKLEIVKKEEKRWWLDFDSVGYEDTVTEYFEIIYSESCKC